MEKSGPVRAANSPHAHIYVSSERYLLASLATSAVGKKRGASVVYDLDPKHFRTGEDTPVTPAPDVVNRNLTSADSDSIGSVLVDECVLTRDLAHMCFEDSHGVEPLPPQLLILLSSPFSPYSQPPPPNMPPCSATTNVMTKPYPIGGAARVAYGTRAPKGALDFAVHLEVVAKVRRQMTRLKISLVDITTQFITRISY